MSLTPLFEVDSSNKSESEQDKETDAIILNNMILIQLGAVICELKLLNARIEEAFDTRIKAADV